MSDSSSQEARWRLLLVVLLYIVVCSVSSIVVARLYPAYHYVLQGDMLSAAIWAVTFAPVFLLFAFARFSFGYFIGFYFTSMVLGYLWLSHFSDFGYNRTTAKISAIVSALAFLLPSLLVTSPTRSRVTVSERAFGSMLNLILGLSIVTLIVAATYHFRFVAPGDASNQRADSFPLSVRYLLGISLTALLPFMFAFDVTRGRYWRAGAALLLMLFYYPVTLTKTALLAPFWLLFVFALLRAFGARLAVILSLLLPGLGGLLLGFMYDGSIASFYFFNVNFRMLAIPAAAMDVYNEFFSKHEVTWFCQIGVLKPFVSCPYGEQLSIVMRQHFPFGGNFNASLFATEGIASVGSLFAPIPVLVGGFVIAVGNRASAGLPPSIVLPSSAIFCQTLLNVPLSTALLSYGGGVLFLLWYLTPRTMFQSGQTKQIAISLAGGESRALADGGSR